MTEHAAIEELAFRLTEEHCRCMFGEDERYINDPELIDCDCTAQWTLVIDAAIERADQ